MKISSTILCVMILTISLKSQDSSTVQTETLSKSAVSWDGKVLPAYETGVSEITILKITIPPGARLPMHKHSFINVGMVLKGELTVVTEGNKTIHLKAGESLIEVVNTWHYGKNEGSTSLEIVVFYAGIQDKPITIKKEETK